MTDVLYEFVKQLEAHRADGKELAPLLHAPAVRHLSVPLCHECCGELRAMAEVFQCDEALLAGAILRGALRHMQAHLDDDLDQLAIMANKLLDSPCERASEKI
ncbi:hypothetical protein [Vogesella sp. LIG4]|uniref:hypothetical protein n=1 Tax=Vogesella sp. LIG4 TaxID=1192162 RepID=UPI00081F99E3|nr:hypothetical protein [Vogesella sp. LIG4]SCK20851.1 hypothetical protein PSELUDRAFT_2326 [Vogesella sp. LIG4]